MSILDDAIAFMLSCPSGWRLTGSAGASMSLSAANIAGAGTGLGELGFEDPSGNAHHLSYGGIDASVGTPNIASPLSYDISMPDFPSTGLGQLFHLKAWNCGDSVELCDFGGFFYEIQVSVDSPVFGLGGYNSRSASLILLGASRFSILGGPAGILAFSQYGGLMANTSAHIEGLLPSGALGIRYGYLG